MCPSVVGSYGRPRAGQPGEPFVLVGSRSLATPEDGRAPSCRQAGPSFRRLFRQETMEPK